MKTIVYVANADSHDIAVLALDRATGVLEDVQRFATGGAVMPLAVRRAGSARVLYASLRSEPYTVLSLSIGAADGHLTELGRAPLPASMCWISTDRSGRFLLSASYGESVVAVSPIDAQGIARAATHMLPTEANAHAIQLDPTNRFAFVPCLGGGLVLQLRFDAERGELSENRPRAWAARDGAGPRHLAFHPTLPTAYLVNELDASIVALALDRERGRLSSLQSISALPPAFTGGAPWAADIHVTPDGRFLYASERRSSTLAGFAIDALDGRLTSIGHVPTEAQPRGFAITADGAFLIAVGQASHGLSLYTVESTSGLLHRVAQRPVGTSPNWVEAVELGD